MDSRGVLRPLRARFRRERRRHQRIQRPRRRALGRAGSSRTLLAGAGSLAAQRADHRGRNRRGRVARMTEMAKTMERQPEDLRRILADPEPVEAGAERLTGRRVFLVGTGTSWHAANQGAYFLRRAGIDALAVAAADCALWGPRPAREDALVLLSHRGTKRYTSQVLEQARAEDVPTVAIGGEGAPGADVETVAQETAGTFTASHLGALARLAEVAAAIEALGTRVYRFAAAELGEPLSVFPLTVVIQRIALEFALQLGTDPDHVSPEGWEAIEI